MADGYLNAGDGKPGKPSVVVIHEWWGLNDQIRATADRFAKEGFVAYAPDLFEGKVASLTDSATAQRYAEELDWGKALDEVRQAVATLRARDPRTQVGVTGFCLGGAVSLAAASAIPEIKACVPFYGIGDKLDARKIKAKVMGHFASRDGWVTPARVDALEKSLQAAGVPFTVHRYDADHAF